MKFWPALAALLTTTVLVAASGVATKVNYIPHDKVSAAMAKGERIIEDNGLVVIAQRRTSGDVEIHEKTNHVFIMVEGEATLVIGGTAVDVKQTAPDQRRAKSIQGGTTYHLTKGDVITIPSKTPHWWKEVPTKTVAYYAVNSDQ